MVKIKLCLCPNSTCQDGEGWSVFVVRVYMHACTTKVIKLATNTIPYVMWDTSSHPESSYAYWVMEVSIYDGVGNSRREGNGVNYMHAINLDDK